MKKDERASSCEKLSSLEKQTDEHVINIIRAMDILIAYARAANLQSAARMLFTAKENLVYWAADQNFEDSPQERFINRHMVDNNLFSLFDLITRHALPGASPLDSQVLEKLNLATTIPQQS